MTVCKRCLMDETAVNITFNEEGNCNYCTTAMMEQGKYQPNEHELEAVIEKIKQKGKGKTFDCLIGLSGGTDSSYVAYLTWKYGLRPLAIHLDNGYDPKETEDNIRRTATHFGIPLRWITVNQEEYRDVQVAFLKASTPDCEIPTDHALVATMYKTAIEEGIPTVIGGQNHRTESIMPLAWSRGHADWKYIKNIHKQFGQRKKLCDFPHYSPWQLAWWLFIKGLRWVYILDYVDYNKTHAKDVLKRELGWQDYGGKHCENIYTRFYQQYILPTKFGYDKRKAHLSSLIVAGEISREQAEKELSAPFNDVFNDYHYVLARLGIGSDEFQELMRLPPKSYFDYANLEGTWYYRYGRRVYRWIRHHM